MSDLDGSIRYPLTNTVGGTDAGYAALDDFEAAQDMCNIPVSEDSDEDIATSSD